jgi:hypothetical protein
VRPLRRAGRPLYTPTWSPPGGRILHTGEGTLLNRGRLKLQGEGESGQGGSSIATGEIRSSESASPHDRSEAARARRRGRRPPSGQRRQARGRAAGQRHGQTARAARPQGRRRGGWPILGGLGGGIETGACHGRVSQSEGRGVLPAHSGGRLLAALAAASARLFLTGEKHTQRSSCVKPTCTRGGSHGRH